MWIMITLFLVTPDSTRNLMSFDQYKSRAECEADYAPLPEVLKLEEALKQTASLDKDYISIRQFCLPQEGVLDALPTADPKSGK